MLRAARGSARVRLEHRQSTQVQIGADTGGWMSCVSQPMVPLARRLSNAHLHVLARLMIDGREGASVPYVVREPNRQGAVCSAVRTLSAVWISGVSTFSEGACCYNSSAQHEVHEYQVHA